MNEEKKIKFSKSYTCEVITYEDGSVIMRRANNNFSVLELLGIISLIQRDLQDVIKDGERMTHPDKIERISNDVPFTHEL